MARLYAVLAGLLAALAGFLALMFGARKAGKDAAENEAKGKALDGALESNRIRGRVKRDSAERDRLHKKYRRD